MAELRARVQILDKYISMNINRLGLKDRLTVERLLVSDNISSSERPFIVAATVYHLRQRPRFTFFPRYYDQLYS